jgi:hypothetical protein
MTSALEPPFLDEHGVTIAADRDAVWAALLAEVDAALSGGGAPAFARLVGCRPAVASGPRPLAEGSTGPGFGVVAAVPGAELRLAGRHRFSIYSLTFRLDDRGGGRTQLLAESRAAFPGVPGSLYWALVVRSGAHVVLTRRLLRAVRSRAESAVVGRREGVG